MIYIDAEAAMAEGIRFFKSDNDMVLTRGIGWAYPALQFAQIYQNRRQILQPWRGGLGDGWSGSRVGGGGGWGLR